VLDVQLNAGPPHVVMLAMMHTLKELREQLLMGGILTAKGRVQLSIPTQVSKACDFMKLFVVKPGGQRAVLRDY
jgi:hypothetical protein